jgi:ABC-type molybdate transport system substrate-binding protein
LEITATIAAIAALGSVVFSWAGLAIILEEAGVNTAVIVGAVAALLALLGAQAKEMAALHGNAVDTSQSPGGHWPVSVKPAV